MFGRRRHHIDLASLKGVITFLGSYYALKAEKSLKSSNIQSALIPGPRDVSPNCGVALRFNYDEKEFVKKLLGEFRIEYEAIHYFPAE